MTNPTPKHQEEARELVREWAARDREIREVLEGLSKVLTFDNGPSQRCWCSAWVHTPACLAARALWEKLQPALQTENHNPNLRE